MLCILCLTASDKTIEIFEEDGIRHNISNVIRKHFWLQPKAEDPNECAICCPCWDVVESFHQFYQKVYATHAKFDNISPLPDDVLNDDFDFYNDCLDPVAEIKLETCEDSKVSLSHDDVQQKVIDTEDKIKSDSDSDVPLGRLAAHKKSPINGETDADSDSNDNEDDGNETDYEVHKKKQTPNNTTNRPEFGKHRIPCNQFDDFIKQNMKLSCNICHISLPSFSLLKGHYRSAHNEQGYVVCCDKKFDSRHALVHHIFKHKNPETYKCEKCGKVLSNIRGLRRHMKTTHVNEERIHQCQKCKKSFRRIELLEKHVKSHVRPDVICEQCGKVMRGKQCLKQHQLREHSGIPKQRRQCPKCGVYLADYSTLHTHLKYQHPIVKVVHKCHICGKISATGYGLKRHIEYMHTRGRPHKCTLCEKAFKTLKCWREHMSTHTGEVLYTCPHCPKTFNSNANMHSHRKKMHRKEWEENRRHPHMAAGSNAD